jgi:hypothetical protein
MSIRMDGNWLNNLETLFTAVCFLRPHRVARQPALKSATFAVISREHRAVGAVLPKSGSAPPAPDEFQ